MQFGSTTFDIGAAVFLWISKGASALLWTVWLAVIVLTFWVLISFESKAGPNSSAPARWPSKSHVQRISGEPSLLMFVHPKCPCSQASLNELAKIMARTSGVDATVLFLIPSASGKDWQNTKLWKHAAAIPGVKVMADSEGNEETNFSTSTSGETLVYDSAGRLRFAGGITWGRGHEGDNRGEDYILSVLNRKASLLEKSNQTPVFGCKLADDARPNREVLSECWK